MTDTGTLTDRARAWTIADRARVCAGVTDLSAGPFGTTVTYLPGERLPGVAVTDDEVEISVVAELGRPLPELAEQVRRAVTDLAGGRRINVRIHDVVQARQEVGGS